ncbi:aminoglycoside phosphotransferase family protein [Actinomadura logoneensis]|uniref:Aminoglycoside phosphotransferase family protein n=1 Tax=Actinomadura logoneensis TaxID=2293572 RepID=A0A372JKB4_9ACTN|nr:aminoglycoside phosphotransferase family protein [Actinomadura logoneensis]RFU40284.1 aminoglycoside phosphotransferase family protein [Actinomadura logoneensis]
MLEPGRPDHDAMDAPSSGATDEPADLVSAPSAPSEPSEPSARLLAWVTHVTGGPVAVVRAFAGGTHAATSLLRTPSGPLVLRAFPPGDDAAATEEDVLTSLDGLAGWVPGLVAADRDGSRAGRPATLITLVPGRADIRPDDPQRAAVQLGRALARVHATDLAPLTRLRNGLADSYPPSLRRGPAAPLVTEFAGTLAAEPRVLTHRDFWSGNVLWADDGTLTGVVDWAGGCLAPRGFDVSWCRLDLHLLHGPSAADAFLDAYERASGVRVTNVAAWDLFAVRNSHLWVETWTDNYVPLGRPDLTPAALRALHTEWTTRCLDAFYRS